MCWTPAVSWQLFRWPMLVLGVVHGHLNKIAVHHWQILQPWGVCMCVCGGEGGQWTCEAESEAATTPATVDVVCCHLPLMIWSPQALWDFGFQRGKPFDWLLGLQVFHHGRKLEASPPIDQPTDWTDWLDCYELSAALYTLSILTRYICAHIHVRGNLRGGREGAEGWIPRHPGSYVL